MEMQEQAEYMSRWKLRKEIKKKLRTLRKKVQTNEASIPRLKTISRNLDDVEKPLEPCVMKNPEPTLKSNFCEKNPTIIWQPCHTEHYHRTFAYDPRMVEAPSDGRIEDVILKQMSEEFGYELLKAGAIRYRIYDDRIMVERHRNFIYISDIKELFKEKDEEALIILNNDDIIPIAPVNTFKNEIIEFEAFINILTKLIEDNKSNDNDYKLNNNVNTEDKFDKLIKLGEMYDKGLLSDEEFDSLKQEILHDNTEESTVVPEEDIETSQNVCRNCGTEVEEDSKFCAECGNKLD